MFHYEKVPLQAGKHGFACNGFVYYGHRTRKDGAINVGCREANKGGCHARGVVFLDLQKMSVSGQHNHGPSDEFVGALRFRENLIVAVTKDDTQQPLRSIYNAERRKWVEAGESAVALPSFSTILETMRRRRVAAFGKQAPKMRSSGSDQKADNEMSAMEKFAALGLIPRFIEIIQANDIIYNPLNASFKSNRPRMRAWSEIAAIIHQSVDDCKSCWAALRKEQKNKLKASESSGPGAAAWPYFDLMAFMIPYLDVKPYSGQKRKDDEGDNDSSFGNDNNDDDDFGDDNDGSALYKPAITVSTHFDNDAAGVTASDLVMHDQQPSTSSQQQRPIKKLLLKKTPEAAPVPPGRKRPREESTPATASNGWTHTSALPKSTDSKPSDQDLEDQSDEYFFRSICARFKKLPRLAKAALRIQIEQAMMAAEFGSAGGSGLSPQFGQAPPQTGGSGVVQPHQPRHAAQTNNNSLPLPTTTASTHLLVNSQHPFYNSGYNPYGQPGASFLS